MDFFDEYWFFHNILINKAKEPVLRRSSSPHACRATVSKDSKGDHPSPPSRAILRAPSMPPLMERDTTPRDDVAPLVKMSNSKLRRSCSSLDDPPSSSSSKGSTPSPGTTRRRPPRDKKFEGARRYGTSSDFMIRELNFRKAFQERKWKSLSDLECFEVQGFKDLGFVFDNEGLSEGLVRVIPGLRDRKEAGDDEKVSRPYLAEAWVVQRAAPPVLRWVDRGSSEEMKDQLRFWARAVACNVRQEC